MDEKKYEAGRVEISSTEYRDLVTEAVTSKEEAGRARSEKWKLESEKSSLEAKLAEALKELDEFKKSLYSINPYSTIFATQSTLNHVTQEDINNGKS